MGALKTFEKERKEILWAFESHRILGR
jgi:hypothetical protein